MSRMTARRVLTTLAELSGRGQEWLAVPLGEGRPAASATPEQLLTSY